MLFPLLVFILLTHPIQTETPDWYPADPHYEQLILSDELPPQPLDPHEEFRLLTELAQEVEQRRIEAEAAEAERRAEAELQAEEAERQAEAEAEQQPSPTPPAATRNVWDRLAECESGNWINGGASFEEGSARWDWAKPGVGVPSWGTTLHHGGLQFHPSTWTSHRLDGYPQFAYDATREQQIAVAERVLSSQGWGAWPTCSRKLGLR